MLTAPATLAVLPAPCRLRRSADFRSAVRAGRRVGSGRLVLHLTLQPSTSPPRGAAAADPRPPSAPRAGFVVSRAVGSAVVRNRVRRRLRNLVAERLDRLPPGSALVVRALPPSAAAASSGLAGDLDRALDRLLGPVPVAS